MFQIVLKKCNNAKIPNKLFYAQLKLPVSEVFQFFFFLNIIPVITCSTTVASFCIVKILPALWSELWEPGSANQLLLVGTFLFVVQSCLFAYVQSQLHRTLNAVMLPAPQAAIR